MTWPRTVCSCRVFVGNLPIDVTEDDLWDLFLDCGYIKSVSLPLDDEGRPRGFGREIGHGEVHGCWGRRARCIAWAPRPMLDV